MGILSYVIISFYWLLSHLLGDNNDGNWHYQIQSITNFFPFSLVTWKCYLLFVTTKIHYPQSICCSGLCENNDGNWHYQIQSIANFFPFSLVTWKCYLLFVTTKIHYPQSICLSGLCEKENWRSTEEGRHAEIHPVKYFSS